jgi:hypothetical protein
MNFHERWRLQNLHRGFERLALYDSKKRGRSGRRWGTVHN